MNNQFKKNSIITRSYNDIVFEADKVIKGVTRDRYLKEIKWFLEAEKIIPNNTPLIFTSIKKPIIRKNNKNLIYYEMQAIDGNNLYQWSMDNRDEAEKIFDQVISLIMLMHQESKMANDDDIIMMYYSKPKKAIENFIKEKMLDPDALRINGFLVQNPVVTLDKVFKEFRERLFNTKYSFIHGDLTMSNIVIDQNRKVYLIDPRGAFGKTKMYGDVRYDVAKLFYSIVGNFDSLNSGQFKYEYNLETNDHIFSIVDNGFSSYSDKILSLFKEDLEIIKFIHTTIWLSLIPHTSNDKKQQLCTFCNGVLLLDLFK
ncbi:hypothetical protein A3C57_00340 [Candidatus Nomurabacteria bacterium RIFCSPHIGHO2_02_FULL_33_12]|uniref:Aminoglycoside phosphotransferase domain-containing protein n=1 Tax=Candidatus Nomurabacteria bacterium RIFCSPLOWO2_01_FULL_33_17 TaxID=1801764 RepID=A0A1F6WN20_9BACT|nr:MAG: hypothetical protein A3C57_00340 [Candidatus Nomurabacteria bacterium RIFCSPHIGHO2_02_FULL_33_12]OGI83277.1 MAG: hypothetical protein A2903_02795 [Candidatus Nomurabacteria bacterium RIFCSPLOWO2_01_FULL_33_17]